MAASLRTEPMTLGRDQGAAPYADKILYCEVSALMDTSTCLRCSERDGKRFGFRSAEYYSLLPPFADCAGRTKCRCLLLYLVAEDVGS